MTDGWIGSWSPGIGDPSWVGWLTVLLYFTAAGTALHLLRRGAAVSDRKERWFWRCLVALLLALGINKQLDLQTALTELGRILAHEQGWYEGRRAVQRGFIAVIALGGLGTCAVIAWLLRHVPGWTKLSLAGTASLLLFVVVRASSFHQIDTFLGTSALGLRWNWIFEVGGLCIIVFGTRLRGAKLRQDATTHRLTTTSV